MNLAGQWAVVTGGSMGIGRAIVERFVGAGANVVAVAHGQEALDEAVATAQTMASPEQQVLGISADVASRPGVDALFDELVDRLPYLNIFVGNAGTGHVTPFLELSDDEFDSVLALNFTGTLRCCQLAGRMMVADPQPNSAIVVVSSIRALGARAGRLIYAATKAGVNQAVRVAAVELAPHGIRVNALSPGITETPLSAKNPEAFAEAVANVPLGRAAQPADLAEAAYFLCSPDGELRHRRQPDRRRRRVPVVMIERGQTAVVTGAANGIGLAMARRFLDSGLRVVLADRDSDALDVAVSQLGDGALGVPTDVADAASVVALAARVAEVFGDVHVLCNNAGVIGPGRSWETSASEWSRIVSVNLDGVVNGLRSFVPAMLAHGAPCHVVNTASGAGLFVAPSFSAYCVSKAAVVALSESLAAEIALVPSAQLQVHVLCPGSTTSNLYRTEVARHAHAPADPATAQRWAATSSAERTDQADPELVVDALWAALASGDLYVLPIQAAMRDQALARLGAVDAALHRTVPLDGGPRPAMLDYFARLDRGDPAGARQLLADDLRFCFARPDGTIEGGRDELAGYIERRRALAHRIDHHAVDGRVELAAGQSVDGEIELGAFVTAMRTDDDGRITTYLASFHPGTSL